MTSSDGKHFESHDATAPPSASRTQRLPRQARLLKPVEFKTVFDQGKRMRTEHLRMHQRPNGLGYARLGLAVPKRCLALATRRNRARRLLRDAFRLRRDRLPAVDLVFLMTSAPPLPLGAAFTQEIARLFERLIANPVS